MLSNLIKAKRNNVWKFISELNDADFHKYLNLALKYSPPKSAQQKSNQKIVETDMMKQIKEKQKRMQTQKRLHKISHTISAIKAEFPSLELECLENIYKILNGKLTGHRITHIWNVDSVDQLFVGWVNGFVTHIIMFSMKTKMKITS